MKSKPQPEEEDLEEDSAEFLNSIYQIFLYPLKNGENLIDVSYQSIMQKTKLS